VKALISRAIARLPRHRQVRRHLRPGSERTTLTSPTGWRQEGIVSISLNPDTVVADTGCVWPSADGGSSWRG
jgi:hypothetical protein